MAVSSDVMLNRSTALPACRCTLLMSSRACRPSAPPNQPSRENDPLLCAAGLGAAPPGPAVGGATFSALSAEEQPATRTKPARETARGSARIEEPARGEIGEGRGQQ